MLTALAAAFGLFLFNGSVELGKSLTGVSTTAGKRFLLAIAALIGTISYNALYGTP
jgi:hypothetical protein